MIRTDKAFDFWARHCMAVVAAAALALGWTSSALAAAGALDKTFSGDGKVTTDFTGCPVADGEACPFAGQDEGVATAVQSDGKIVVAGYVVNPQTNFRMFALARYNRNGSLDTSFGTGGKVTTDVVPGWDTRAFAVAMQGDQIVLVGSGSLSTTVDPETGNPIPDFATLLVVRYNHDGSLDESFGTDGLGGGVVTFDIADRLFAEGEAVAVQGDKIVVAGTSGLFIDITGTAIAGDFLLVRFSYDGSLDTTLAGTGWVTTDFTGKNPNGIPLDENGVPIYPDGDSDEGTAIALTPDGKIVVAGLTIDPEIPDPADPLNSVITTEENIAVARYNWDGSLDTTFGMGGQVVTDITGILDESHAVAVQRDGKIVVAGTYVNAFANENPANGGSITEEEFALLRYNVDGNLDNTFGWGGRVATDFSGGIDIAHAVALQPDGKIVVAGMASSAWPIDMLDPNFVQDENFAVARYNINGTLDVNFATKVSYLNKSKRLLTKTGGKVETDFDAVGELDHAFAVVVDGYDIIAAGTSFSPVTGDDFAIAVYDTR